MKTRILSFFIQYYTLSFLLLSLGAAIGLMTTTKMAFSESFVRGFLFFNVGLRGVLACIANFTPAFANEIADSYGWPRGQSFQKEIASADGAFGAMGMLTPLFSAPFALATAIGFCICTILSEFSGLLELYHDRRSCETSISKSIIAGMCIDFGLSAALLSITLFWYFKIL